MVIFFLPKVTFLFITGSFFEGTEDSIEMATTSKLLFNKFLEDLSTCVNRELIDRAGQDFCMTHNTKRNRKRLAKSLFSVHRTR